MSSEALARAGIPIGVVSCDECNAAMPTAPEERQLRNGGVEVRLVCPWCEAVFPIVTITAKGLRIRAQLRRVRPQENRAQRREYARLEKAFRGEVKRVTRQASPPSSAAGAAAAADPSAVGGAGAPE